MCFFCGSHVFVWLVTGMTPMRLVRSVAVLGDGVTLDVIAAAWLRDKALSSAKSVVELMICIFGFGGRLSVLVLESGGWAFVSKGRFMGKQWILSRGVDKGHGMFTLFLHRLLVCWSYTRVAYCFTGHSADLDPVHFGVKLRPIDVIIFNNVKALYKSPARRPLRFRICYCICQGIPYTTGRVRCCSAVGAVDST